MNPILQNLQGQQRQPNGMLQQLSQIRQILGSNPQQYLNNMLQNNKEFQDFVRENQGLNEQQIMQKFGLDPNILSLFK